MNTFVREKYYQVPNYKDTLHDWLAKGRRWDIEYQGYLSNHLTHNWVVMGGVGASEEYMQWWQDLYTNVLDEKPAREPGDLDPPREFPVDYTSITEANWRNNIQTTRVAFSVYRDFFDARLQKLGLSQTIQQYLPALLPGLVGAAFHAVIHTGWATDVESIDMAGEGLAYMATAFQPLATNNPFQPPQPLWSTEGKNIIEATLEFLTRDDIAEMTETAIATSETEDYVKLNKGGFQQRIITFDDPRLSLGNKLNETGSIYMPDLNRPLTKVIEEATVLMAAALHGSDNEFFVLHGLTSLHGVLCFLPHIDPVARRDALVYWWRGVMATMVVQNRPGLDKTVELLKEWQAKRDRESQAAHTLTEAENGWWLTTINSILCSRDEHVPKAVYALWRWSAWSAFSKPTVKVFETAARNIVRPHSSGHVDENLWFAKSFSEASKEKELMYD
ncbi:MAG: questin oxidase family protein [Cyanobacteria bacterium P01_E01_bin.35]